jgi:hypothetical protein
MILLIPFTGMANATLILSPVDQSQRIRPDLFYPVVKDTLLLAGEPRSYSGGARVEETAGFTITFDVPELASMDFAILYLTIGSQNPTKPDIETTGFTDVGFTEAAGSVNLSGFSAGDSIAFNVTLFVTDAISRGANTLGFNFSGSSGSISDNGFVYLADSNAAGAPILSVEGVLVPAPSAFILMGSGMVSLIVFSLRKKFKPFNNGSNKQRRSMSLAWLFCSS